MGIIGLSSLKARHSGTWKDGTYYAKHVSLWKPWRELWKNVGGTWQRIWVSISAVVSGNFGSESVGGGLYRDRAILEVTVSPSPSSYVWEYSDSNGRLTDTGLIGSTLTLTSSSNYNPSNFNTTGTVTVWCTVTIAGQSYRTPDRTLGYTISGFE